MDAFKHHDVFFNLLSWNSYVYTRNFFIFLPVLPLPLQKNRFTTCEYTSMQKLEKHKLSKNTARIDCQLGKVLNYLVRWQLYTFRQEYILLIQPETNIITSLGATSPRIATFATQMSFYPSRSVIPP